MSDPIPSVYNEILNALMVWGKSGLISNTGVVKSYHPPSIDNITGVTIAYPATVFKTDEIKTPRKTVTYKSIDELNNAPGVSGSNVKDFNVNDIPTGPDTSLAHFGPVHGVDYKKAALTAANKDEYEKNIEKLNIPIVADRITENLAVKPVMITDEFEAAKTFYKIQPLSIPLKDNAQKTPLDTRKPIPKRYELLPTKVPCAIPGVLNCYLEIYDKVDVKQPTYTYTEPTVQTGTLPDSLRGILKEPVESAIAPFKPKEGDRWWDTVNNKLYVYDGTTWKFLGTNNKTVYTLKGEKNY